MEPILEQPTLTDKLFYVFHDIKYFIKGLIIGLLYKNFQFSLWLVRKAYGPSNLVRHAESELYIAGFTRDGDKDDIDYMYGKAIAENVLELISVFSIQGHSGMSASITRNLFDKLADFSVLSPLTGEDDEWKSQSSLSSSIQNKRCSRVFKDPDGKAYDIEGKVFVEPNGSAYTSGNSFVEITFPYIPKKEYVNVDYDGNPIEV